jgi:hypothetical protein
VADSKAGHFEKEVVGHLHLAFIKPRKISHASRNRDQMEEEVTKISATPNDLHDALVAEVADFHLEDEWKDQPNTENDWDTQIAHH